MESDTQYAQKKILPIGRILFIGLVYSLVMMNWLRRLS